VSDAIATPTTEPAAEPLPADAQPKLISVRGLKLNMTYPIYEGENFIGRSDEQPVDIDLEDQEKPESVWSSRQHAVVRYEGGRFTVEDLKSSNGTYVNRTKCEPGTPIPAKVGDIIQIGAIHLKITL
jgi:pSer/pThr/pTyr-binding forkhead associated (FHA) protein